MLDEFKLLVQDGYIGFYNKCEVIEIFGFDEKTKKPFNIFTLLVFEDTSKENLKEKLTDELQIFPGIKKIKWGIQKRIVDIETAEKLFDNLLNNNIFQIEGDSHNLNIGSLKFIPKQYIQKNNDFNKRPINHLLKNNFHNGSYIIEGFDESKENINFLLDDPVLLNQFSEQVSGIIPVKIGNLSDRLGNIIFQFPINYFKLAIDMIQPDLGIELDLIFHDKLKDKPTFYVKARNSIDDIIWDTNLKEINSSSKIDISTSDLVKYTITDKKNGLVVFEDKFSTLKSFNFNLNIASNQDRIFSIDNDIVKIPVSSPHSQSKMGKEASNKCFRYWMGIRKYEHEARELEKKKSFIQYFGSPGENIKALEDARSLIKQHGGRGVYLWDPYLNAKDIKSLLYYCANSNAGLKAITGLKQESSKTIAKKNMIQEFQKDDPRYLFLNLEVRAGINGHGYDFHDRFLIFPLEQPKVWSLGISVNQLGKSHHILQQVRNSQHILNAFNKLWNSLEKEECLVWKII